MSISANLKYLIVGCILSVTLVCPASKSAGLPGFLEGRLKILLPKPVQLDDENAAGVNAENYADYPLLILTRDGQKEVARLSADTNGNYRAALPPGDYILDVQGRPSKRIRAKPRPFTIVSNQTVRVDMEIDLDHSRSSSTQSFQPD